MSELEAAYLAGCLMGDGHVSIWKCKGSKNNARYKAGFAITSTERYYLQALLSIIPGSFLAQSRPRKNHPTWKASYEIRCQAMRHLSNLLDRILPYLWYKKDRTFTVLNSLRVREIAYTALGVEVSQQLCDTLAALNYRGHHATA